MRVIGRRCRYHCHVRDEDGDPHFVVKIEEEGYEEVSFDARTPRGMFSFYTVYGNSFFPTNVRILQIVFKLFLDYVVY